MLSGTLASLILNRYEWSDGVYNPNYEGKGKIEVVFGKRIWDHIKGKTVLDFGCGTGMEAIEMARNGAAHVIGLDVRESILAVARSNVPPDVTNCEFVQKVDSKVDVITSMDAFEHFRYPDQVLEQMATMLQPEGKVIASFGPPWYHPKGGHFPLFPWAHLVISEDSLMTWRARYKTDGARRFEEVEGGLNQMSIGKFERLVAQSPLRIEWLETVPIRRVRLFHNYLTREFFTSLVRCVLLPRSG